MLQSLFQQISTQSSGMASLLPLMHLLAGARLLL